MAQVKILKDTLEQAFTTFKRNKSALSRTVSNATASTSTRALKLKIDALEDSLNNLNSAHTLWVSKTELSGEALSNETFSNEWLESQWAETDDLVDKANIIFVTLEDGSKPPVLQVEQKTLILEEQMKSLQLSITNQVDILIQNTTGEAIPTASHAIYTGMMLDVKKQLNGGFRDLSKSLFDCSGANLQAVLTIHEQFHQTQEKRILDVQINLARLASSSTVVETPVTPVSTRPRSIEMEKCKAPSFSGSTIDYPEFKRGWQKVAASVWDDDNQIEQMKFKIDPHTKIILSRCKNMTEVWEALDNEYGQEQEVVNAVNAELKLLISEVCSTSQYIVKLRNHLPRLEEALNSVGGLEHLQTPDKVNLLVENFDERTQYDWEYYKSKASGRTYDRFLNFILDRYDSCRSTIARLKSRDSSHASHAMAHINHSSMDISCFKCKKWVTKGGSRSCAACGHTTSEGQPIGHCLDHCTKYKAMTANQRSDCVKNANWCPVHLSSTHNYESCTQKNDARVVCGINGCTKHHHHSLHGGTTSFVAGINALHAENEDSVLLSMQSVSTASGNVNCFFDDGSNRCLILHSTAERLGLIGEDVIMQLTTVIGENKLQTKLFSISLIDDNNEKHIIQAFGVPRITGTIEKVNVDGLKELFSCNIQNVWDKIDTRPSGEVELLVGSNYSGLHPYRLEANNNVKVLKSMFGSGYILVGSHRAIKPDRVSQNLSISNINISVRATKLTFKSVRDYFDSNELHVEAPRRCNNCMNCTDCTYRGHQMSLREQYEFQAMENNVTYDNVGKVFRVEYPFMEDPSILTNNFWQAVKIGEREEKKLEKEQLTDNFNQEFDRMIAYGALVELTEDGMNSWTGPVHYVSLQHVLKPESTTTPLRIVTNSSLSDRNGNSLNSILMKGPNSLSDQRDVISRWRCYEEALSSDLTKAYFAMKTGELEMHVRRVVWRYGKTDEKWRIFGYKTVSFGDKPAGAFLDIVINKVASMFKDIDPPTARKIMDDRYVDDFVTGGSPDEVQKMMGSCVSSDNKFETNGTLSQILSNGSLKLKAIVSSGEEDNDKISKLGRSVLGITWDPTTDVINIDLHQNDSLAKLIDTDNIADISLTKRTLLGIINKPHDLLGLISPITVRLMAAYRDLFRIEPALDWDDEIPQQEKAVWVQLLRVFNDVSAVTFPRATKPKLAAGNPEIMGYFDGSDDAFAAVAYLRWTLSDGSFHVTLASSKAKVTPLKKISTPRSELNGAVLLGRLVQTLVKSCVSSGTTPEKVWLFGDSECTLASIEKTSGAFGEYFGNRVGDILDNQARIQKFCNVGVDGEWYHVSSADNAADQATRLNSTAQDISNASPWQKGPSYLYLPKEAWPINRDFADRKDSCIPNTEILRRYRGLVQQVNVEVEVGVHKLIDPFSTNCWDTLIQRTQVLLKGLQVLLKRVADYDVVRLELAEKLWFLQAMKETREAWSNGRLNSLFVEERDGLVVVSGRAKSGLQKLFGKEFLPVLIAKSRVAFLIMLWAHTVNHDARDITMAIACSKAWIINAKRLATSITNSCIRCRFLHKIKVEQKMAALPPAVQLPCPPFSNIGIDLCGPLIVHAMTNKRATLKVWNVIFVCLNTKAVTMYLAPGYATEDFLIAYNSHISDHGLPTKVHSDKGSQLVAAGKQVADFDWEVIARKSSMQGTTWDFAPAGAQWRNGAVEIFVKKFKNSFEILYGKTRMNFAEMACALKRLSKVLNDRPLSVQKSTLGYPDADFLSPITPNMIITGRSGSRAPIDRDVNYDELPEHRLSYIEELERAWWYQYKVQYFTSLVPSQKWFHGKRNMLPGDIVLIEYKCKSFPGTYRLGRVKDVEVDPTDGLVRTCTVIYKLVKPSSKNTRDVFTGITSKEIRIPVQRLVLIMPVEEQ